MSSRKRKNRSQASQVTQEPAEESTETESSAAPAVSQIKELRPKKKRRADEAAPELEEAASAVEPEVPVEAAEEDDDEPEPDAAAPEAEAPKDRAQLKRVVESLLFVSDQVMTPQQLGRLAKVKLAEVRELVAELSIDYEGRGIELVEVNGGYQFRSAPSSAAYVRDLVAQRPARLTRAQLETLALIAYRQPITRPEIDDVRGVDSGSAIKVLTERELVKILGRKDEAGRPLLYGTTPFFLEFFGMNTMQELPTLREFTELTAEHRELFQRKLGEVPDLSAEAAAAEAAAAEEVAREEAEAEAEADADADADDLAAVADEVADAAAETADAAPADGEDEPTEPAVSDDAGHAELDQDDQDDQDDAHA